MFWFESNATITDNSISFEVHGDPQALRRARLDARNHGHFYNPSGKEEKEFRDCVGILLQQSYANVVPTNNVSSDVSQPNPVFSVGDLLVVSLRFLMKRPLNHFICRNRSMGLKNNSRADDMATLKSKDLDNLVKFCLDSLIGKIYADDANIISIQATKELDCNEYCLGRTVIELVKVSPLSGTLLAPIAIE